MPASAVASGVRGQQSVSVVTDFVVTSKHSWLLTPLHDIDRIDKDVRQIM